MHLKALSIVSLLSLATAANACLVSTSDSDATAEDIGQDSRAIKGGSKATGYPEAVLINTKQSGQLKSACSGALVAPHVVLTAGHCVFQYDGWDITAPYASGGQTTSANQGTTLDWKSKGGSVDPNMHDFGLIFLDQPISLASYPKIATAPAAKGTQFINIGRINNGSLSYSELFVSKPLTVTSGDSVGFPLDYSATTVIEPGDSGGPDLAVGTHTIFAVNSRPSCNVTFSSWALSTTWLLVRT